MTEGNVINEIYLRTEARPIEVVGEGLREIEQELGDKIRISGVGTTGSGRELIGELVGADTINDEITSHKTGASFIGRTMLGPQAGHDLRDRRPGQQVHQPGASGDRGRFHDERGLRRRHRQLPRGAGRGAGRPDQGRVRPAGPVQPQPRSAWASAAPCSWSATSTPTCSAGPTLPGPGRPGWPTRSSQLHQPGGARPQDRRGDLLPGRHGLQRRGGRGLQLDPRQGDHRPAVQRRDGRDRRGPAGPRENARRTAAASKFRGFDLEKVDYTLREFTCKGCTNYCQMQEFNVEGEKTYWGDKCSDRYRKAVKCERKPVIDDLIELRRELLLTDYDPAAGERPGGRPAVLHVALRLGPVLAALLPRAGGPGAAHRAHHQPHRAPGAGVGGQRALLPDPGCPRPPALADRAGRSTTCSCPTTSAAPGSRPGEALVLLPLEHDPALHRRRRAVHLRVRIPDDPADDLVQPRGQGGGQGDPRGPGPGRDPAERAPGRPRPWSALSPPRRSSGATLQEEGGRALARIPSHHEHGIILLGRPYNIYDRGINLDVATKLRKYYGVNVVAAGFPQAG